MQCFSLRLSSSLHLFVFLCLISLLLLCVLCPTSSGLFSDFSPAPLEFARLIFCVVLFSFKFAFFPSLIESSFDSCKVGSSLLLHGQSVRRVLFHSVYCGVIFSAPVDFESLCFPLHFSVIWYACFATRASSSVGLLPCPSVFAPLFS